MSIREYLENNPESFTSEAAVGAVLAEKLHAPIRLSYPHPDNPEGTVPFVALPEGLELKCLQPELDKLRTRPERRKGTAKLQTLDSLIDHVRRFKSESSALFANPDRNDPSLTAVLNYHEAGASSPASFGDHRGVYRFPLSDEWTAWQRSNECKFSQEDFAAFIEDRILDVADPTKAGASVLDFCQTVGATLASPSRLMDLSRGLQVHVSAKAVQVTNLSTGEGQITYTEEHKDGAGGHLGVPGAFLLQIPVFRGDAPYQVPVRLRYRLRDGVITWFYSLYRTDRVFEHAFVLAIQRAAEATGLPLFIGTPE